MTVHYVHVVMVGVVLHVTPVHWNTVSDVQAHQHHVMYVWMDTLQRVSCMMHSLYVQDNSLLVLIYPVSNLGGYCIQENPCYLEPCRNNGTCSRDGPHTYSCDCLDQWSGVNCTMCNSGYKLEANGKCVRVSKGLTPLHIARKKQHI